MQAAWRPGEQEIVHGCMPSQGNESLLLGQIQSRGSLFPESPLYLIGQRLYEIGKRMVRLPVEKNASTGMPGARVRPFSFFSSERGRLTRTV